jgi:hypothetical protein
MTAAEHPITELPDDLSDVVRTLFRAGGVVATLQSVVHLARASLGAGDYVGALVSAGALVGHWATSDPLVGSVEGLQLEFDEGPTREVISRGGAVYVDELAGERRWPRFAAEATGMGVRSLLTLRLAAGETVGALTLYSRSPRAFGPVERARASSYATVAAHALSVARVRDEGERRLKELQRAISTRELIGQAQGILMERERITAEQAFDILRTASQRLNVKLLEVALRLVETGESPTTGQLLRTEPAT